jgi:UDPglucose 6-dehydrogenase
MEPVQIVIIAELSRLGVNLQVYDPEAEETSKYYFEGKVKYAAGAYEALEGAEALLLLTEWREFREPDFNRVKKSLTKHVIFDGRNLYKKPQMNRLGFTHYGIGMA